VQDVFVCQELPYSFRSGSTTTGATYFILDSRAQAAPTPAASRRRCCRCTPIPSRNWNVRTWPLRAGNAIPRVACPLEPFRHGFRLPLKRRRCRFNHQGVVCCRDRERSHCSTAAQEWCGLWRESMQSSQQQTVVRGAVQIDVVCSEC
jgi:hypothetical protein